MKRCLLLAFSILAILATRHAIAGMPSVLPEDFVEVLQLKESASQRFQSISFFAMVFVVATLAFWGLWNHLARSFAILPRLNIPRAACLTLLLASLFIVVLTMISGARELLTPGAWRKQGATYTLAPPEGDSSKDADVGPSPAITAKAQP